MEGDCKAFFTLPASREDWRKVYLSQINYQRLLPEEADCRRAVASSLEYTPCTEVYNAGENCNEQLENESLLCEEQLENEPLDCNEQLENASLPGPTFNGEFAVGSSSVHTNTVVRVLPVVAAFAVQCARCLKWRFIPSKAKYEAIRACILECPWVCEDACSWRSDASCEDEKDTEPDDKFVWAMDVPNISVPPPGWIRDFVIRSRGASKFGDIYYISPCGKKLRSMVEVDRFLNANPIYGDVSLDRFSYKTPKPYSNGYVGERRRRHVDESKRKMRGALNVKRKTNAAQVKPFARREHGESSSMVEKAHLNGSGCELTNNSDIREIQWPKKKRSTRMRPTAVVTNWKL